MRRPHGFLRHNTSPCPVIIRAVIFTHRPDLRIAGLAAKALQHLGVEVALALDQLDINVRVEGCTILRTTFPRKRNLNGIACADGILATLQSFGDGADWILKVDSDTLVFGLDWFLAKPAQVVGVGYPQDKRNLFGMCYAVRPEVLPDLREKLIELGEGEMIGEDILIGNAAEALGALSSYPLYAPETPLWGWNYNKPREVREAAWQYQVICTQPRQPGGGFENEVHSIVQNLYTARYP